ncbi:MAG: thiazole synthase [Bacteroidetes bacterium QS_8_68_28]|nr:MAG: thiazole synthase [Bacteroidetes bacterium QS_8_68_28]
MPATLENGTATAQREDAALTFGDHTFSSRLLVGSGGYASPQVMLDALGAAGVELVTVSIRRSNLDADAGGPLSILREHGYRVLPNTAGCFTAKEAVLTAQLAREALQTDLIKLEVIGDDETLLPDTEQLIKAAGRLVDDGFTVLAYANDDPIVCRKLASLGCAAVMPGGAPIGSGQGLLNPYNLRLIREEVPAETPLIVDAGIGTASDATQAMELGYDGLLVNTAISGAKHPEKMARAMRRATEAGRGAFEAGRPPRRRYAQASSPTEGRLTVEDGR